MRVSCAPRILRCCRSHFAVRQISSSCSRAKEASDPRIRELGRLIEDDYAVLRNDYGTAIGLNPGTLLTLLPAKPKNPVILAHGLFGFDQLHLAGSRLPGISYWRGITEALAAKNVECFTASVSPSGSIEGRAEKLRAYIRDKAQGRSVNIIASVTFIIALRPY